jgi:hypothetical protein
MAASPAPPAAHVAPLAAVPASEVAAAPVAPARAPAAPAPIARPEPEPTPPAAAPPDPAVALMPPAANPPEPEPAPTLTPAPAEPAPTRSNGAAAAPTPTPADAVAPATPRAPQPNRQTPAQAVSTAHPSASRQPVLRREAPPPPGPRPEQVPHETDENGFERGATGPQLRRFIKSRAYVPMHELRRRFAINGDDDEVTPVDLERNRVFVGLPEREGRLLGDLLRGGDIGYELSLDPISPIVVGVYPMRPVTRG